LDDRTEPGSGDVETGPDREDISERRARRLADGSVLLEARHLTQGIRVVLIAALVAALPVLAFREWRNLLLLGIAVAALLLALRHSLRGRTRPAATILVVTVVVMVACLGFGNGGLYDESLTAFPAVLLVASMFGTGRLYVATVAGIVVYLSGMVLATRMGWYVNAPQPVDAAMLVNLLAILLATAYYAWVMSRDLRLALADLKEENVRMRESHERLRESHARIDRLARHDSVTGLPNRVLARDRFEQNAALAQRTGHRVAVLFLDLDDFKTVNDSQGHASGDALLAQVGARLARVVRASDTVSRQGGDEFLILLGGLVDGEAASTTAVKIIEALSTPFDVNGLEVSVTCSLGIALYPDHGADFDTLLKNADMAMYRAKSAGRNTFRFYDARMLGEVLDTLHLMAGIRSALAKGEFFLVYQPQVELASGRIVGVEALIRWHHPELGLIAPEKFIPIAERSGLINAVGTWVLKEACRQMKQWQDAGLHGLVVSVNVSPAQFRRDEIEREILDALAAAGLAPQSLELELTESLLIDESGHLGPLLGRLRALGLRFSIDDFGTGYSNLGYLRRFEVERLKIDQSFVRHIKEDAHAEGIVRAIIEMAGILKLELVAEGVEDQATLDRLVEMGCGYGQGNFWSPAVAPEELAALVQKRTLAQA
jgi:diguanylate cyclase (GGDEF)-like protein